ncbi:hypothetical protein E2C01_017921 [Portunus trituberculatus]|uniref:Uncharacterized protein n=1 Tax=Portunus trituberculatus TaxID=210409 RepID=A0A5B7DUT9_PORTR|nr:hypothetical protein [Portunus trituberculatus]
MDLPIQNIAWAGGKGPINIYCQLMKKIMYPSEEKARAVFRVSDNTTTSCQFEKFLNDPWEEVKEEQRVFRVAGSLEVDVLVVVNE